MSIGLQLGEDLKNAMRAKDKALMACIRQVRAKVQEAVNAEGFAGEINDALYVANITSYVKSLRKGIQELAAAGERSQSLRDSYAAEIAYLDKFLPALLDEAKTEALVRDTIAELGITAKSDVGRLMGAIMKKHRDKVDPQRVRDAAEKLLG